ncbi:hypothetical protein BU23DRAFT_565594 [Bimuria novae-zelandiae CBS 107.79]|uniref:Uncharacterized protein n=1 Tax=Bimuria novae-zelandiae CBS 107.79 TaxID=1447943 RepID=A0A6A5VPV3_9PLEO|nr:hypothetical protein BU23DRAFT_565594 [Bimuria novae-zelandiae CBS 107.79]
MITQFNPDKIEDYLCCGYTSDTTQRINETGKPLLNVINYTYKDGIPPESSHIDLENYQWEIPTRKWSVVEELDPESTKIFLGHRVTWNGKKAVASFRHLGADPMVHAFAFLESQVTNQAQLTMIKDLVRASALTPTDQNQAVGFLECIQERGVSFSDATARSAMELIVGASIGSEAFKINLTSAIKGSRKRRWVNTTSAVQENPNRKVARENNYKAVLELLSATTLQLNDDKAWGVRNTPEQYKLHKEFWDLQIASAGDLKWKVEDLKKEHERTLQDYLNTAEDERDEQKLIDEAKALQTAKQEAREYQVMVELAYCRFLVSKGPTLSGEQMNSVTSAGSRCNRNKRFKVLLL